MGKRKSSRLWIQMRKKDQFYRLAKERGYRSRASFKLLQAVKKYGFIRYGDRVIDIGAAPGGWLQATRRIVGGKGRVYGFDLESIEPLPYENVLTEVLDIAREGAVEVISNLVRQKVNAVLSDASPNVSGVWEVDHARQIFLANRSLEIAVRLLHKNGSFFVKLFHGPELNQFEREAQRVFRKVALIKPPASKARSSEIYLLGTGFLGQVS
jgi:23S rRNA (uridine2552-2'-O)-methyltransferase